MSIRLRLCMIVALTLALWTSSAMAQQWTWKLSPQRYQALNTFERAQYEKSARLYETGDYKAAAIEFEKFSAQFPDSDALSYVAFMRALSLHSARQRHTAIKVYNDVLDYFGEKIEDAAPALYYMGMAHIDNGDTLKGIKALQEMAEDEDYSKHPLAAGALRALAENHWRNKEVEPALKYWKQIIRDFETANPDATSHARYALLGFFIKNRDYAGLDATLINYESTCVDQAARKDTPAFRTDIYERAWYTAYHNFGGTWDKYTALKPEEKQQDMQAFFDFLKSTKPWWEKANHLSQYYDRTIHFSVYRWDTKEAREQLIEEAVSFIKTVKEKDKKAADALLSRTIDTLRDGQQFDRARYCVALMEDRLAAAYKEYEILARQGRWEEAVTQLQDIEGRGDATWKARAEAERARIYKDVLNQLDKAVALYQQINQPPGTLWSIVDCYRRGGKLNDALTTLNEIENAFPDQAARAAWHKASYLEEAGEKQKAIASAKRLLQLYPKSPESSSAHQMLERYGIATGGGVSDEQ